jgi:hypothetical protein
MADERFGQKLLDRFFALLMTRWWPGLLLGAATLTGGAYRSREVVQVPER